MAGKQARPKRQTAAAQRQKRWIAQLEPSACEPRDLVALATGMSGLALSKQRVALELVAISTSTGVTRHFQVRAETLASRQHLCAQLQELYPQASMHPLLSSDDPLLLGSGEAVSCRELRLGAPAYLPLRTWQRKERDEEGTDPLLHVLASLKMLPPDSRAVVQLVLTPAKATWSRRGQRFAQEHPLEDERFHRQVLSRAQMQSNRSIEQELFLEGLGLLLLLLIVGSQVARVLPAWVGQAASAFVNGQSVHLSAWESVQLVAGGLVALALVIAIGWLILTIRRHFGKGLFSKRVYDPALVRQKTAQMAYRSRLRLYIIGPQPQGRTLTHRLIHHEAFAWKHRRLIEMRLMNGSWWKWAGTSLPKCVPVRRTWKQLWAKLWSAQSLRWQLFRRRRKVARVRAQVLERLVASYRAYHLASGNFFVERRAWFAPHRMSQSASGKKAFGQLWWRPNFLTPDEVASLFHLISGEDLRTTAFVERVRERSMPVPLRFTKGSGEPIGTNVHQSQKRPVFFLPTGFTCNLLALAGTGKGKSSLFAHLARVLFADSTRRGSVLLDPHGDLAQVFLGVVPKERRDDVVFLNLADREHPVGFNLLDMSAGPNRDRVADTIVTTYRAYWRDNWGPRIDATFHMSLLTLCEVNLRRCKQDPQHGPARQCTMLTMIPLLQQPTFRKALLREVWDPEIHDWWNHFFQQQPDRVEIAASVLTKVSKLSASRVMRRIVGQPVSTISLPEIVTGGRLLLVNTASGIVGDDTATLFGSIFLGLLHASIAGQAEREASLRTPMYLFLDELQKFSVGVNLNAMLAELRKYGGNFALATQSLGYLDALDPTLRHTLLANTDHLFAFDMSAEDAESMAAEFGDDGVRKEDILSLDNYACYAKLTADGARHPTFSLHLSPPPQGDADVVRSLTEKSARVYGTPAGVVDKILGARHKAIQATINSADQLPEEDDDDGLAPDYESINRRAAARKKPWANQAERSEVQ